MGLLPPEIAASIPKLYATENAKERIAYAKLFDPSGLFTLYVMEFDGDDTIFGYVVSPLGEDCSEWGYSSLSELEAVRNPWGLPLERDLYWKPCPIPGI